MARWKRRVFDGSIHGAVTVKRYQITDTNRIIRGDHNFITITISSRTAPAKWGGGARFPGQQLHGMAAPGRRAPSPEEYDAAQQKISTLQEQLHELEAEQQEANETIRLLEAQQMTVRRDGEEGAPVRPLCRHPFERTTDGLRRCGSRDRRWLCMEHVLTPFSSVVRARPTAGIRPHPPPPPAPAPPRARCHQRPSVAVRQRVPAGGCVCVPVVRRAPIRDAERGRTDSGAVMTVVGGGAWNGWFAASALGCARG